MRQRITLAIEREQRLLHEPGYLRTRKVSATVALVEQAIGYFEPIGARCFDDLLPEPSREAVR